MICPANALKICGEEKTTEDVVQAVLRDKQFYEESGGGITLSGGEPLLQFDFSLSLLKAAKEKGIHTAIETSGYTNRDMSAFKPYVDLWLFDIKVTNEEDHIKYVGKSNKKILKNLFDLTKRKLCSIHNSFDNILVLFADCIYYLAYFLYAQDFCGMIS